MEPPPISGTVCGEPANSGLSATSTAADSVNAHPQTLVNRRFMFVSLGYHLTTTPTTDR